MVNQTKVDTICCNQPMVELIFNTNDGTQEKHVPVINVKGDDVIVKVGSVEYPIKEKHFIRWICIKTNLGHQIKYLKPNDKPEACFKMCDNEQLVKTYTYCNIHGLWAK